MTSIDNYAFWNCTSLTTVDCSSVTEIGDRAFAYCTSLTTITFGSSLETIGEYAFSSCTALTTIDCSNVETIGEGAFYYCTALTTVIFGSSLETIGEYAFNYCSSLESFEVDENNSNFCSEDGVLFNIDKTELIRYPSAKGTSYTVPDTVTTIAKDAFCSSSLESITLSSSVTAIGNYAFENCSSLTYVFYGGTDWNEVNVGSGNSCLTSATIITYEENETGVTITGCTSDNTSIIVPSEIDGKPVTSIENGAFDNCSSLESFKVDENNPNFCSEDGVLFNIDKTELIRYPSAKGTSYTVPDTVTKIAADAFCSSSLESITLSSSVTAIGNYAFENCSSLAYVFYGGTEWNEVNVGSGNSCLTSATFITYEENETGVTITGCTGDNTSIIVPSEIGGKLVTSIENGAFDDCTSLTDIYYEGSNEDWAAIIGEYDLGDNITVHFIVVEDDYTYCETCHEIYYDGYTLTYEISDEEVTITGYSGEPVEVVIPEEIEGLPVTTIGKYAFWYCASLTTVDCSSVTTIDDYAFQGCKSLTTVDCSNAEKIGEGAFSYCDALTNIDCSNSKTIGEDAFFNCISLTTIICPSVTEIGEGAFYQCESLKEIDCSSAETIGNWAFEYCTSLTTVAFGSSLETIGEYAFDYCSSLESFEVDENNPNFCSEDGVLFNKDKTELIRYPSAKGTSYTVPDTVTKIAKDAFCSSSLESITLSSSVTSIGNWAFWDCASLSDVYFYGTETEWNDINIGSNNTNLTSATIHYLTVEDGVTYCTAHNEIFGDGYILEYDYVDATTKEELKITGYSGEPVEVVIPESLGGTPITTIGEGAFYECDTLTTIDCSSVTTIGNEDDYYGGI